jgi:hypothetical protein
MALSWAEQAPRLKSWPMERNTSYLSVFPVVSSTKLLFKGKCPAEWKWVDFTLALFMVQSSLEEREAWTGREGSESRLLDGVMVVSLLLL